MKITPDTNVLVRVAVQDDPSQTVSAMRQLREASLIALTLPTLCEFAWVLKSGYKYPSSRVADAIRLALSVPTVSVNRAAVEAGLAMLEAGGDFADGVIAYEGRRLGGETFVSFDRKAVALSNARGEAAQLLS